MPLLFSYGTLQHDEVQISTFGTTITGLGDELPGFAPSRASIDEAHVAARISSTYHANVVRTDTPDSLVSGTALEISDDELLAADRYEAIAGYKRIEVRLASRRKAWVYVD